MNSKPTQSEVMTVGEMIKDARNQHRLTQAQVAKAVGKTPGAITRFERDDSLPNIETMMLLVDVLGLDKDKTTETLIQQKQEITKARHQARVEATTRLQRENEQLKKEIAEHNNWEQRAKDFGALGDDSRSR